jgi:integrase
MATKTGRLTAKGIERRRPPAKGRVPIWDSEIGGFGILLSETGRRVFHQMIRINGKTKHVTIGPFCPDDQAPTGLDPMLGDPHTLAQARAKARWVISIARRGLDPVTTERAEAAARARADTTFATVRDRFITDYCRPRNRSWRECARYLERDLASWNARPMASLTADDIRTAIKRKLQDGDYASNRLRAYLCRLCSWAVEEGYIETSPAAGIRRQGCEVARDHVLALGEVARLWDAWDRDRLGWPYGPIFKLMLITGQRRGEVSSWRWQDIHAVSVDAATTPDLTPIAWEWRLSGAQTKSKRSHAIPLSDLALQIISELPRFDSPYLFPAFDRGQAINKGHIATFARAKKKSDQLSNVYNWRLHDLRRTAASNMAALGTPLQVLSRVLNHSPVGTTAAVYDRHTYAGEMRRALAGWSQKLAGVVGIEATDNIVDMADARAGWTAG